MSSAPLLNVATVGDTLELRPTGSWTVINANVLESLFSAVAPQLASAKRLRVDLAGVLEVDTLGAWELRQKPGPGAQVTRIGVHSTRGCAVTPVTVVNG